MYQELSDFLIRTYHYTLFVVLTHGLFSTTLPLERTRDSVNAPEKNYLHLTTNAVFEHKQRTEVNDLDTSKTHCQIISILPASQEEPTKLPSITATKTTPQHSGSKPQKNEHPVDSVAEIRVYFAPFVAFQTKRFKLNLKRILDFGQDFITTHPYYQIIYGVPLQPVYSVQDTSAQITSSSEEQYS